VLLHDAATGGYAFRHALGRVRAVKGASYTLVYAVGAARCQATVRVS
jgi:hypothetical protein